MCVHLVPPPPSSILVSPAVLRHSIPHLYKHSPSSTNSHAHAYRRHASKVCTHVLTLPIPQAMPGHPHLHTTLESKASDITHLLDPSYSPTGTHYDHNQIYVDYAGEVHDPDFHLFTPTPMRIFASDFEDDKDEDVSLYSTCQQPLCVSVPHVPHPYLATHDPGFVTVVCNDKFGYAADKRCKTSKLHHHHVCRKGSTDDVDERCVEWM